MVDWWLLYLIKNLQVLAKNNINEKNKVNKLFDNLMREIKETKQKILKYSNYSLVYYLPITCFLTLTCMVYKLLRKPEAMY